MCDDNISTILPMEETGSMKVEIAMVAFSPLGDPSEERMSVVVEWLQHNSTQPL